MEPKKTPLHALHLEADAKMVDFGGWDMPINYGSQIDEHHAVRQNAGMFDVSHMTVIDLEGPGCRDFLRQLLANNIDKVTTTGGAIYSCMLNHEGGVIDDLIVYYLDESWFRMVVNAATRDNDMAWINAQAQSFDLSVTERPELAMIAVQGPDARARFHNTLSADQAAEAEQLKRFSAVQLDACFVARTGYTGEDGYEIVCDAETAQQLWRDLLDQSVQPCGLGARDTLRLESAMNLYGQDMDETVTPLESALGWTVALDPADRDFNGREALVQQKFQGVSRKLTGLMLEDRGVLRHGQVVQCDTGEGVITSGSFSPTADRSVALARLPADTALGDEVTVQVRKKSLRARVVKPPFVKNGESTL